MTATWAAVPHGSDFTLANLPYGVVVDSRGRASVVVRIGDAVLDVAEVVPDAHRPLFEAPTLNPFLSAGPTIWREIRARVTEHLTDARIEHPLTPVATVTPILPMQVGDYVDFYSSLHHATNLGRLFRPDQDPLLPNWRHLPVGYHGRSATVAVSGTPVTRPTGLVMVDGQVSRRPSAALDIELEVGFVVGPGNEPGRPIRPDEAADHVFGAVLVNDWSARDLQAFEYQPLGPFLGKSFLTTVSPWVVPLEALTPFLVAPPVQHPPPDPFLRAEQPWGLDLELAVVLNDTPLTRTNFSHLYWTFAQQLAHLTSNGAITRPGDLFASGTVSGPTDGELGSLIEATWRGQNPLRLADGTERSWLLDGDTVTLTGWAGDGAVTPRIGFGEATGTVVSAPDIDGSPAFQAAGQGRPAAPNGATR